MGDERPPEESRQEAPAEPERTQSPEEETPSPQASFNETPEKKEGFGFTPPPPAEEEEKDQPEEEERWSAQTTAFPKMSFGDLPKADEPEPASPARNFPWESAPEEPESEGLEWPQASPPQQDEDRPTSGEEPSGFGFDTGAPGPEAIAFTPQSSEPSAEAQSNGETGEERWPSASAQPPLETPESSEAEAPAAGGFPVSAPGEEQPVRAEEAQAGRTGTEAGGSGESGGRMNDEDVDRIARRVVELLSDKAVRDIAWEVIPDLAEAIVRDRIRQLETQD